MQGLADALVPLMDPAICLLRRRQPGPVQLYLILAADAVSLDLASSAAVDFQRRFNGFYGVRRNADWRAHFYRVFEASKAWVGPPENIFGRALAELEGETRRVEASFVSKLVATLHPEGPVIDSIVRRFLAERLAAPRFGGGSVEAIVYYAWLRDTLTQLSRTEPARAWSEAFGRAFSDVPGAEGIHPIKRLDFLIWAGGRPAADPP